LFFAFLKRTLNRSFPAIDGDPGTIPEWHGRVTRVARTGHIVFLDEGFVHNKIGLQI